MATAKVIDAGGTVLREVELPTAVFGREPNIPLLHQVVVAELAGARRGTHSTRTRAEVSGGGAKPYRQKGTGNARQGSIRAPQFKGGGIVHGPKPRSYEQRTPRKMVRGALAQALSDRAQAGVVYLLEQGSITEPSTKAAVRCLRGADLVERKVLALLGGDVDEAVFKSVRNLPTVRVHRAGLVLVSSVLASDAILLTEAGYRELLGRFGVEVAK
jgi:large subunit ribosomal protein L4